MKAMAATSFGTPDVLAWADVPEPTIGPRDVLVEVDHAAINPVDTKVRQGYLGEREFPLVLGFDVSGVVRQLGSEATRFKVGEEVYGCGSLIRPGGNAPLIAIDERIIACKPANLTHAQAAALPLVTLTAWESLIKRCRLHAGQTVLIQAGGGGVGHIAIQLARMQGARVLTTASSDASIQLATLSGADVVINYKKENVLERVKEETQGKGCQVVFDTVGDATFNDSLQAVALNGQIVTILGPDTTQASQLFRKNATLHFEFMGVPAIHGVDMESHGSILATAAELAESDKLMPHIHKVVDLDDLAEAHRLQETGRVTGKIVVRVKS